MPAALRCPVLLAALLATAACEIKNDENPRISIIAPDDGALNDSSSVLVQVEIDRFTLDPATFPVDDDTNSEAFKGHWHLYLDRFFVDDQFTTSALLTNVDPGVHELAAELVNQNHQYIHGTPVSFSFVEIPADAPGIVITNPDNGTSLFSSSVELSVELENLVLDTNLGSANVAGRGHFHVAIDGGAAMEAATTSLTLTGLAPISKAAESATITVELVNNDHTSFTVPVLDQATVSIPATAPRLRIDSPIEGATVGTALTLTFTTANFDATIDFATAVAESNGQGHYHVLVDGVQLADDFATADPTSAIPAISLAPGDHEVRLEFRSNQHDPLSPPVVDIVHVTAE